MSNPTDVEAGHGVYISQSCHTGVICNWSLVIRNLQVCRRRWGRGGGRGNLTGSLHGHSVVSCHL